MIWSDHCVFCVLGRKSNWALTYSQGPSSPALFVIHMSSWCSQGEDCVQYGGLRTSYKPCADDMVLFASSDCDLHVFWDGLQLRWRSAPSTLRPWFSARNQLIHSLHWDGDSNQMKDFYYLWVFLLGNVEFSRRLTVYKKFGGWNNFLHQLMTYL